MDSIFKRTLFFITIALIIHFTLFFTTDWGSKNPIEVTLPAKNLSTILDFSPEQQLAKENLKIQKFHPKKERKAEIEEKKDFKVEKKTIDFAEQNVGEKSGTLASYSGSTSVTEEINRDEIKDYIRKVTSIIDSKKRYPRLSRENREEGRVMVRLTIGSSGKILGYGLVKSSPYDRLNNATLSTIKSASFPPLPKSYKKTQLVIEVPVSYVLKRSRG